MGVCEASGRVLSEGLVGGFARLFITGRCHGWKKKKRRWAVREEVGNFEAQRKYKGEIVGGKRGALQGKDRAG